MDIRACIMTLGGIRATARAMGVPASTVNSWHKNGTAPSWRVPQIEAALKALEARA